MTEITKEYKINKNYQFIALSVCESRRILLEKQFNELKIEELNFLENPSTLSNSTDYLSTEIDKLDAQKKKYVCATKSYISALQVACLDSSPEFTVILEDDVSCHKSQFISGIEEIIENWDQWIFPSKMVSIGWIPLNNLSFYTNLKSEFTLKSGVKVFNNGTTAVGFQASIFRKKDIQQVIHHFVHTTFGELKKHLIENFPNLTSDDIFIGDNFINKILGQARTFPPLAIEQNLKSTLGHNNTELYWSNFFRGYEFVKNNYWSF